ncbi:ribokinase [Virgibacillus sp. MSP4-1]|uniref:ribokinase n=1 Tax=Virgibacillus sp. MSP4-1 TaxID=2700081 RepID=UPI0003A8A8C9|nr:ribokinase [Virgibacillus sp. MSP4-1]QHS23407.1 ribokinase [Virgibacillus sp. MSP4-1]
MKTPTITVIGSINTDMITATDILPNQGETVLGQSFQTKPGGKGANQAVAAARLGGNVQMIGRVGDDQNGADMLKRLEDENIDTSMVDRIPDQNTGIANILLSNNDNQIIIIPGANDEVTPDYVKQYQKNILASDFVLIQFEVPEETVLYCLDLCHAHNIPMIVNPAPAKELPVSSWSKATYITPNESEAAQLFNLNDMDKPMNQKLIITQGKNGVSYCQHEERLTVPSYTVTPVDTTGAGDTFNGALTVALSEQKELAKAIQFANAASALSVQKLGAQEGMPTRKEVETFLAH